MKTKLLGLFLVALGVFAFVGVSSASQIVLQPATDAVSPGNATTSFESLRVGVAGGGGVTFFNGSIINESGPMVIADDLRIDGEIWRGTSKGDGDGMPLKISDSMVPTLDATNDLGSPNKRWKSGYFSEEVKVGHSVVINSNKITSTNKIVIKSTNPADPTDLELENLSANYLTGNGIGLTSADGSHMPIVVRLNDTVMFDVRGNGSVNVGGIIWDEGGDMVEFADAIKIELFTDAPFGCDSAHRGAIYYDTAASGTFKGCTGAGWVSLN